MKPLFWWENQGKVFCNGENKSGDASSFHLFSSYYFPFTPGKQWPNKLPNSLNQNKGILNYVFFCRNWAVRNPTLASFWKLAAFCRDAYLCSMFFLCTGQPKTPVRHVDQLKQSNSIKWHMTKDMKNVTHNMWHMTYDTWREGNIL